MRRALVGALILATVACRSERWEAFVYPDKNDLAKHVALGTFASLEACRQASTTALTSLRNRFADAPEGDYECGLNCEAKLGPDGPKVCEKTER